MLPSSSNPILNTLPVCSSKGRFNRQNGAYRRGSTTTIRQRSYQSKKWLLALLILGLFAADSVVNANDEIKQTNKKTLQPSPASPSLASTSSSSIVAPKDEIYIDDEGIEGSGGRPEIHDDLEKDSDYSGSGFGPDDEDSSTDQHQHHHRRPSQAGNTNTLDNSNNNNDLITSRTHHQTNSGTIIGNSGTSQSGTNSNTGIIGSSGSSSGNTGINTIGKDHDASSSSSSSSETSTTNRSSTSSLLPSEPTTTKTKIPQHTITTSTTTNTNTSINPTQTNQNPSFFQPKIPAKIDDVNEDNDDFDLDENIGGAGSGDHGVHDHDDTEDDDDDEDGDDMNYEDEDDNDDGILSHINTHHNLGAGIGDSTNTSTPSTTSTTTAIINDKKTESEKNNNSDDKLNTPAKPDKSPSSNEDIFDEEHTLIGGESNYDDHDLHTDSDSEHDNNNDNDDDDDSDNDDGDELFTDVTVPYGGTINSDGTGSSGTTSKIPGINNQGNIHELGTNTINSLQPDQTKITEHTTGNEVLIMNASDDDRTTSFFAQPGILAAVIGGAVVGLLCAILVVMFIVYRMRKKDEGSYALDEPKRSPAMNSYAKNANNREFYA